MKSNKSIPVILQIVIYTLYGFLFGFFLFVRTNIFSEANFSKTSNIGSLIMCVVVGTILSFVVTWIIGKVLKYDSNVPLTLLVSFLSILITSLTL